MVQFGVAEIFFQLNVLIDDKRRAVLCNFGFSSMKADVTSRGGTIVTGRNWMAPERIIEGSVWEPSDIYAFGMVIYEVNPFYCA